MVDPDQTTSTRQSDLGPYCFFMRLDDKNIHFVIMRFKGE